MIDTKQLGLLQKWDLAYDLPLHITEEQLPAIIDTTTSMQSSIQEDISNQLKSEEVSQEQQSK